MRFFLVKFIEKVFFGDMPPLETEEAERLNIARGGEDIPPGYVDMSKAIPIRGKRRLSKRAKKSVKKKKKY